MKKLASLAVTTALATLATLATGCFTTTIHSGRSAAPAAIAYDERWHHGVVAGLGELSGPYDLSAICPNGWSEIETKTSFPNIVAELVTGAAYAPQTITVRCAAAPLAATTPPTTPASVAPGGGTAGHGLSAESWAAVKREFVD